MSEPWQLSGVELAAAIRAGRLSAREATASVLDRIAQVNPALNAIVVDLGEQAMADAAAADEAQARAGSSGAELGLLHGVPVTIKENVDQQGQATTNGVPAFADVIAPDDSPVVRNLRRAGAIIVGRTNTPELSMRGTTVNPLRGRTWNPWDPDASAGGSSGGAGAAAAAGLGPIHHGNDIGGSLRYPAFVNGVATVKPTSFRVPTWNPSSTAERGPLSLTMSVQGVIAREVGDVRLATRALIAPDPRDPNSPPVPWDGPALEQPITVAVTTDGGGFPVHPGIVALIEQAATQLADAGYRVVRADPPPITEPARAWFRAGSTELEIFLDPVVQAYGSDDIKKVFRYFFQASEILDRDGYARELADRNRMLREWNLFLDQHPLVLCPFLMMPTYRWDFDVQDYDSFAHWLDAAVWSFGVNYLGLPAGVLGTGLVEGLPAGFQLVGRRWREDLICDALEAVEARNGVLTRQLWAREAV